MICGSSVSDHLGKGTSGHTNPRWGSSLAATRSRARNWSWNNCDLSRHHRAIKRRQVAVLWSLLIFARKTVRHPSR